MKQSEGSNLYIIIGMSGAGKTILAKWAQKELGLGKIVTHTVRNPRENEINGVDYHFVTMEEFQNVEKIEETLYAGINYGTSKQEIVNKLQSNQKFLLVLDINGVKNVKKSFPESKVIFISIPIDVMEQRMHDRNDSEESIQERIKFALDTNEMDNAKFADFVIENINLEDSKKQLRNIILG